MSPGLRAVQMGQRWWTWRKLERSWRRMLSMTCYGSAKASLLGCARPWAQTVPGLSILWFADVPMALTVTVALFILALHTIDLSYAAQLAGAIFV